MPSASYTFKTCHMGSSSMLLMMARKQRLFFRPPMQVLKASIIYIIPYSGTYLFSKDWTPLVSSKLERAAVKWGSSLTQDGYLKCGKCDRCLESHSYSLVGDIFLSRLLLDLFLARCRSLFLLEEEHDEDGLESGGEPASSAVRPIVWDSGVEGSRTLLRSARRCSSVCWGHRVDLELLILISRQLLTLLLYDNYPLII